MEPNLTNLQMSFDANLMQINKPYSIETNDHSFFKNNLALKKLIRKLDECTIKNILSDNLSIASIKTSISNYLVDYQKLFNNMTLPTTTQIEGISKFVLFAKHLITAEDFANKNVEQISFPTSQTNLPLQINFIKNSNDQDVSFCIELERKILTIFEERIDCIYFPKGRIEESAQVIKLRYPLKISAKAIEQFKNQSPELYSNPNAIKKHIRFCEIVNSADRLSCVKNALTIHVDLIRKNYPFALGLKNTVQSYNSNEDLDSFDVNIYTEFYIWDSNVMQKKGTSDNKGYINRFCFQLLNALQILHQYGYVHRDLTFDNIILDNSPYYFDLYLTNFGDSRVIGEKSTIDTFFKAPHFRAPEALFSDNKECFDNSAIYSDKLGAWSAGVILLTIFEEKYPFITLTKAIDDFVNLNINQKKALKINIERIAETFYTEKDPESFVDVLKKMVIIDPQKRWSCTQAYEYLCKLTLKKEKIRVPEVSEEEIENRIKRASFSVKYFQMLEQNSMKN